MNYNLVIPSNICKYLESLSSRNYEFIIDRISILEKNPRCYGSMKLKGKESQYRIRKGDFRIIYYIDEPNKIVVITDIAHRKDIYKKK